MNTVHPLTPEHSEDIQCALCLPDHCPAQKQLWGCLSNCGLTCDINSCDWTCPRNARLFVDRWLDVGGWPPPPVGQLRKPELESLPRYLPQLHHGSRFDGPLALDWVGLKASRVISRFMRQPKTGTQPLSCPDDLRSLFKLKPDVKVILISVSKDRPLETYWEWRVDKKIPQHLAGLGISAMTIPNFSYFPEAPHWHTHWNFHRMMRVAEELSEAGIGVIPHISTITAAHRREWVRLLSQQTHLPFVAREFQTGARHDNAGKAMLDELRQIRDDIGRPLHPLLVGGARYWHLARKYFGDDFTVVDSYPFMTTVRRQMITTNDQATFSAIPHPLPKEAPLDELWAKNYGVYSQGLARRNEKDQSKRTKKGTVMGAQRLF